MLPVTAPPADPTPPMTAVTERSEPLPLPAPPQAAPPQAAAPEPAPPQAEAAKPESVKTEPVTPEPPKPAGQKVVSVKPASAPPLLPQGSPSRPEIDDTKSVLARLRQQPPAATPARQQEAPPTAEPKIRTTPSPSLPRLTAARAALANGRVEDARRLLQAAQRQLVFRSVDTADDDVASTGPSSASRGAANVARALEALSANDLPLSRRYIDVAANDLSGNPPDTSIQQTDRRTPGYAPAYPPR